MSHHYFDYNATTPLSPEVREALQYAFEYVYGNASSIHRVGQVARQHLEEARERVATALGCSPREIIFVSGGTEADNLAILGAIRASKRSTKHVITTAIEHPAVLNTCQHLEKEGIEVTYVPVSSEGTVDPDDVRKALKPHTVLISVMHANNEVGTIQPIEEIAKIGREAGVLVHSDGVQAFGKIPVNVRKLDVDLYSVTAHKNYGPKGIGALYVREGTLIDPILYGGHHERDLRPGTENVPLAIGFGVACKWKSEHLEAEARQVRRLRDLLEELVMERIPDVRINGQGAPRVPNTSNLCFEGVEAEALVIALDLQGYAVSTGAACSSGAVEPSHVLMAMGLGKEKAKSSVRISLGRFNTEDEVHGLVEALVEAVNRLRKLSPLYGRHA